MNRVQGDYFETLLYKIFVSIDEHTNMFDLASVLQVDLNQVKVNVVNALLLLLLFVCLFCCCKIPLVADGVALFS